jgi:organic hydroperoxide reductase OsmC/OhrA
MVIKPKEYTYQTQLEWLSEKKGTLHSLGKPSMMVACPPEFGGHPDIWTPEDLFVGALEVCIMTTFLWFIKNKKINLLSYKSQTEGTVSMVDNIFQFSSIRIHLTITVSTLTEKDAIKEILKKIENHCLISQSIKSKITITADINTEKT